MECLSKGCSFWSDLAKYVLNSCSFESECCDCCKIHFETSEVKVGEDSDSEVEVVIQDCFLFRHNNK